MIKSENLAREGFEDIFKSAKSEISKIYPGWTNHNTSDPGIMILELLAYLTEVQQYRLNFIHRGHYLRYLKLLGAAPRETTPSKTYLKLSGSGTLPEKTLFYADELPFETAYTCTPNDNDIVCLQSGSDVLQNEGGIFSADLKSSGSAFFHPFGKGGKSSAEKYPEFKIKTKNPVMADSITGIYFSVTHTEKFSPIRSSDELTAAFTADNAKILLDETMGFTKSGVILIKAEKDSDEIVFRITSGGFAAMPILTAVILDVIPAYQKKTLSYVTQFDGRSVPDILMKKDADDRRKTVKNIETDGNDPRYEAVFRRPEFSGKEFLGKAAGLCDFRVKLDIPDILPAELAVFVNEEDGICKWEVEPGFDRADKLSRVCVFDPETSELVFGDGRKGMPPRGEIYLFGCAVSAGENGNVKSETVNSTDPITGISAVNILPSTGGAAPQSIDDCFAEVQSRLNAPDCCITLGDFENAVRSASGVPNKRVKAFVSETKENVVCIAAECLIGTDNNAGLMRNIRKNLLPRVLVGTRAEFPAVRYSGINIFISVSASLYYSNCKEQTEKALRDYFNSDRVNFGGVISANDISRYVCGLPWINTVKSVDLSVSASDGELLVGGDIRLKNVCLPFADKITVTIYN